MKYLPFLMTLSVIVVAVIFFRNWTFDDIVGFTPDNLYAAAAALLGLFAVKSMSVVIPLTILFVAAGIIFTLPVALIVCIAGVGVCFTLPYAVGRISGSELIDKLVEKLPAAKKLRDIGVSNQLFTAYVTRAVVFVPGDLVSMMLGAAKLPYPSYIAGSILGVIPELVFQVAIGHYVGEDVSSKMIIILIVLIAASFAVSFTINKLVKKKLS